MSRRLIFVYNADSGLFNTLADMGHKLLSPQTYPCRLCALTHTLFAMRTQWKRFLEGLPSEPVFLHRDEFIRTYPDLSMNLPAVLVEEGGNLSICLDTGEIGACRSPEALQTLVTRCLRAPPVSAEG